MAMPRLAGGALSTFSPSIRTSPEVASSSPAMTRSSVDLPQPDGPTKMTNSPSSTSRSMPFSTSTLPKDLRTFSSFREPTVLFPLLDSESDGLAGAHAFVGREADARATAPHRPCGGQGRGPRGSPSARRPARSRKAPDGRARRPSTGLVGVHELAVRSGLGAVQADDRGLGVRVDVVRLGASRP